MCHSASVGTYIVWIAKHFEFLFWFFEVIFILNLLNPRFFVEQNIKFINSMLRYQGVVEQIRSNENVVKIFKRDMMVLVILNALVIVLISWL